MAKMYEAMKADIVQARVSAKHVAGRFGLSAHGTLTEDGIGVANFSKSPNIYPPMLARAEFIVRACNSHDDLLAALQALERAIANNEPFSRAEHEQALAAIQKATT